MLQRWSRLSLRFRLFALVILCQALILAVFLYESTAALQASSQQALDERLSVAELMGRRIDEYLRWVEQTLISGASASGIGVRSGSREDEQALIEDLFNRTPLVKRLSLTDAAGSVIAVTPPVTPTDGVSPQPYGGRFLQATEPLILPSKNRRTLAPTIEVVIPVRKSGSETVSGYLLGWIDLSDSRAAPLLYPYKSQGGGWSELIDDTGQVLSTTNADRLGKTTDHAAYFKNLIAKGEAATGTCHSCHAGSNLGRSNDVLAFAPLTSLPWGVVLRQSETEAAAPTRALALRLGILAVAGLIPLACLMWITAQGIVGPLQRLGRYCREIAAGDLTHPIPTSGMAEVLVLAGAMENMRAELAESRARDLAYQQTLEQSVEVRTAELVQSRDDLIKTNANLAALTAVAAALSQSLDLRQILDAALGHALMAVRAESGAVYLREADRLVLAARRGAEPGAPQPPVELPLAVMYEGENGARVLPDPDTCGRLLSTRLACGSLLCIPLQAGEEELGMLLAGRREKRDWVADEQALLGSISSQMALAARNARLYAALQQEERTRAELLHQAIAAQEDERKRIARELHDDTSQTLTALMMGLDTVALAIDVSPEEARRRLAGAKSVAAGMLENTRRLIGDLRPSLLDDLGLEAAIAWYGEQRLKPLGINLRLESSDMRGRLSADVETALFRIVQEALSNVVRHARASEVVISLGCDDGQYVVCVTDDGCGFDPQALRAPASQSAGLGLRGMEERAGILGGRFRLLSAAGEGTTIIVRVPANEEAGANGHNQRVAS